MFNTGVGHSASASYLLSGGPSGGSEPPRRPPGPPRGLHRGQRPLHQHDGVLYSILFTRIICMSEKKKK